MSHVFLCRIFFLRYLKQLPEVKFRSRRTYVRDQRSLFLSSEKVYRKGFGLFCLGIVSLAPTWRCLSETRVSRKMWSPQIVVSSFPLPPVFSVPCPFLLLWWFLSGRFGLRVVTLVPSWLGVGYQKSPPSGFPKKKELSIDDHTPGRSPISSLDRLSRFYFVGVLRVPTFKTGHEYRMVEDRRVLLSPLVQKES